MGELGDGSGHWDVDGHFVIKHPLGTSDVLVLGSGSDLRFHCDLGSPHGSPISPGIRDSFSICPILL